MTEDVAPSIWRGRFLRQLKRLAHKKRLYGTCPLRTAILEEAVTDYLWKGPFARPPWGSGG